MRNFNAKINTISGYTKLIACFLIRKLKINSGCEKTTVSAVYYVLYLTSLSSACIVAMY